MLVSRSGEGGAIAACAFRALRYARAGLGLLEICPCARAFRSPTTRIVNSQGIRLAVLFLRGNVLLR